MLRNTILAGVFGIFASTTAHALDRCESVGALHAQIQSTNGDVFNLRPLHGGSIVRAAQIYNRKPPATNTKWTDAWLLDARDGGGYLFVGIDNQICRQVQVTRRYWHVLTRRWN
jgi:hypothetical protein